MARRIRVLIIDDEEDFARSMAEYLELDDYEVDVRFTGRSGIEAARENAYDQIMIDIVLPDINGVETMEAIQRTTPAARIVLMTGYSAGYLDEAAVDTGSIDVLTKPVDPKAVSAQLAQLAAARSD